jgi:hypothetical protein
MADHKLAPAEKRRYISSTGARCAIEAKQALPRSSGGATGTRSTENMKRSPKRIWLVHRFEKVRDRLANCSSGGSFGKLSKMAKGYVVLAAGGIYSSRIRSTIPQFVRMPIHRRLEIQVQETPTSSGLFAGDKGFLEFRKKSWVGLFGSQSNILL